MDEVSRRRVFVGGLYAGVTGAELQDRFQRFGTVTSVEVKCKRNQQGAIDKTFAYIDFNISEGNYKKCLGTYNNTKWKGGIVTIQPAKECFITRLKGEREAIKQEQESNTAPVDKSEDPPPHPRVEKRQENFKAAGVKDYHVDKAVPGTAIDGEKNWVVGKYGRVVPIVYIRRPDKKKIMKVDPSKYVHHLKVMKDQATKTESESEEQGHKISNLTWSVPEVESNDYKKRIGEFDPRKPAVKRSRLEKGIDSYDMDTIENKKSVLQVDGANNGVGGTGIGKKDIVQHPKDSQRDDFEVVGLEDVGSISTSHSSYRNRNELQISSAPDLSSLRTPLKLTYDSDNESCGSADTDEICSAKKTVAASNRTAGDLKTDIVGKVATQTNGKSGGKEEMSVVSRTDQRSLRTWKQTDGGLQGEDESESQSSDSEYSDESDVKGKEQSKVHSGRDENIDNHATSPIKKSEPPLKFNLEHAVNKPTSRKISNSKPGVVPQITKESLASLMGETSSEEESEESSEESFSDSDDEVSKSDSGTGVFLKPGVVPQITKQSLASLMGETSSSEESEESSEESFSDSEDMDIERREEDEVSKSVSGTSVFSKPDVVPRITKESLASLMGETSSSEESEESSKESSSDSDDMDIERKEEDNGSKSVSGTSVSSESVKQNCRVINAILSENRDDNSQNLLKRTPKLTQSQTKTSLKTDSYRGMETEKSKHEAQKGKTSNFSSAATSTSRKDKNMSSDQKKAMSNEARLESMRRKQTEMSKQKALIQGALTSLDSKDAPAPGKHFRFDSDDSEDDDGDQREKIEEKECSEKSDPSKKKGGLQLFDSDDEGNDDGMEKKEDVFQFDQPQYEGKSGAKLMKLQSRFGGDDRFKMDTRFIDEENMDSEDKQEGKAEVDSEDENLQEEKKRSLAILEKIVGTRAMAKTKPVNNSRNAFKDLSALHYDPSKEEHSKFEQKDAEPESTEADGDGTNTMQREEQPAPEVSKETFYEVSTSLKDVFSSSSGGAAHGDDKTDKTTFTFFSQDDDENEDDQPPDDDINDSGATPLNTLDLMWKPKKFTYDSSDSEQEDVDDAEKEDQHSATASKKRSADTTDDNKAGDQIPSQKFFFQEDDIRLKEGPVWFFNVPNAAHRQEKMKEKNEELKAGFRKRHRRAVRTWNRKKMEKQQRKSKR
ncbi:nucleolar protein 8-like [Amphiura filiformis]|uniref:nucleolar protein 8-like n=1 Tax=Amphiura filiformis TaxID=82378 RepID=UPI003B20C06D